MCLPSPLTLPLLEGNNSAQLPRQAAQALQGPPTTSALILQVQLQQQQVHRGHAPHHTHSSGLGHPGHRHRGPIQVGIPGLLLQDMNFCGKCASQLGAPPLTSTLAPFQPLTCLRKGHGQLDQSPIRSGTDQGMAGLLWVSYGTQQGMDMLLQVQGHSARW